MFDFLIVIYKFFIRQYYQYQLIMILLFLVGFFSSFLGYTPPSVLNMTALKVRLNTNKSSFNSFVFGALFIIVFQAYLSFYITNYISNNQLILIFLKKVGILVLLSLSIYFFWLNKKEKKKRGKLQIKKPFISGIILSSLNMFAIPFFCGIITLLTSFKLIDFSLTSILFFTSGCLIGAYLILFLYGKYAFKIQQKTGKLTYQLNLVLSLLTAVVALFTVVEVLF